MPAVAERQDEVEQQRQQQERPAFAVRQRALRLHGQRHAGPDVDQRRHGGADRGQAGDLRPPRRQLPHPEGRVPRQREERQHDGVGQHRGGAVRQAGQRSRQREAAGAEAGRERDGEDQGQGRQQRHKGGEQAGRAAEPLGPAGRSHRGGRGRGQGERSEGSLIHASLSKRDRRACPEPRRDPPAPDDAGETRAGGGRPPGSEA